MGKDHRCRGRGDIHRGGTVLEVCNKGKIAVKSDVSRIAGGCSTEQDWGARVRYVHHLKAGGARCHVGEVAVHIHTISKTGNADEGQRSRSKCPDYAGRLGSEVAIGDGNGAGAVGAGKYVSVRRAKIADREVTGRIV